MVAGRYRLDERIGNGPMGEVWRGYDTRADWTVAVKLLRSGAATREVLQRHAEAVARVIHPNVAMVLDVGDEDGTPYLVTEFLGGESLGEELATRGPLPVTEACDLVGQAAAGLDAAHRVGVVHGQVGPGSFRRAGSGVLKVVGFGVAGIAVPPTRYTAPEQAAGRPAEAASDLYALGCVCYELLCGRPPFEDAPEEGRVAEPAPPSRHRAEVPAELDRLVLSMLAADPAARPSGGEPVRRALAAIARPRPQTPPPGAQSAAESAASHGAPPGGPVTAPHGAAPHAAGPLPAPPGGGAHQPPRAGDTAVYDALPPDGREPASNRKLFVQLGVALAVIAAVTVAFVVWGGSKETPTAAPTPTPAATLETPEFPTFAPATPPSSTPQVLTPSAGPSSLQETAQPKATLSSGAVPPGGWSAWVWAFENSVTAQRAVGDMNPRLADKTVKQIRKAAKSFERGREDQGRAQIREVMAELRQAQARGEVPASGPLPDFLGDWRL
ncbi:serine/threonine-protein kinase [Nonomuraea rhodomycinica]|uniref:non-specific serine/threonine protein kinase n=1 Tax=Nonomuraea rhodomycinica TaxID=1712872 RepID=A0A7Y6MAW6_9ACTN|nr:serine/threonine-protein kinase [Nonomuraea rhodomycinica]NUW39889.1 serine/threonine protein kinase [Nonomuraea rhodomycinica]